MAFAFLCGGKNVEKQKDTLKCVQVTKIIPEFIHGELRYKDLERFVEHIQECDNCREELSIQFLVHIGLLNLEEGDTFDLQEELDIALEDAYRRVKVHKFLKQSVVVLGIIGLVAVLLLLLFLW